MPSTSRPRESPGPGGQGFISPDLNVNTVIKSGYYVNLLPAIAVVSPSRESRATAAAPPESIYYATAEPVTLQGTGTRSFATDARGTIFQNATAVRAGRPDWVARHTGSVRFERFEVREVRGVRPSDLFDFWPLNP